MKIEFVSEGVPGVLENKRTQEKKIKGNKGTSTYFGERGNKNNSERELRAGGEG